MGTCSLEGCDGEVVYAKENKCKPHVLEARKLRYRTDKKYYLNNRYNVLKQRAEGRSIYPTGAKGLPFCTREEFINWCNETMDIFDPMWKTWQDSEYDLTKAPSVDRIDPRKGYEIENLQWLTQSDNSSKRDNLPFDYGCYRADDKGHEE